ncbi:transcription factor bHLH18 [Beta vulgaris subsp. vulgaris]|uniref:transcription factor bHLH18 n=1 Tax=Beta vulgaris subsp. vulgaris TaxID=3555 RepID=UPI0020373C54|nr:transcription factor bHLH18 [Beta vulgaris subsp. vulgaris]
MEAWLAQLEMETDPPVPTLINNSYHQYHHSETIEASFDEDIAVMLGEDFPYTLPIENNNKNDDNDYNIIMGSNVQEKQRCKNKEMTEKQAECGGTKRKRRPDQVQDHIIAERKRRELLSQMFISLSTMVPGLKKVDKTSVLGEAITYIKKLQERVKILEEVAAKRTIESMVVVKKSQIIVDDNDGDGNESSSDVDDNSASNNNGSLPEIEIKMSEKTLLLRVHCEQQRGTLRKLMAEIHKHEMNITNFSVIPFENLTLEIAIVAQMEKGFNKNVEDFARTIRSVVQMERNTS